MTTWNTLCIIPISIRLADTLSWSKRTTWSVSTSNRFRYATVKQKSNMVSGVDLFMLELDHLRLSFIASPTKATGSICCDICSISSQHSLFKAQFVDRNTCCKCVCVQYASLVTGLCHRLTCVMYHKCRKRRSEHLYFAIVRPSPPLSHTNAPYTP